MGEPEKVDVMVLSQILGRDLIPVLAPLATSADGTTFNVNADTFASALAARASRAACARRFVVDAARAAILTRLREERPRAVLTSAEFVRFFVGQRALAEASSRARAVLQSFHSDLQLENVDVARKEVTTVLGSG